MVREAKRRRFRIGERELGLLDRFEQQVAEIIFDDVNERADFLRRHRLMLQIAQLVQRSRRFEERQKVPALHLGVKPGRHRQYGAVGRPILRAASEFRRDQASNDLAIEGVAGDRNPIVGENLVAPAGIDGG
jgi:hypothetical protein